MSLSVSSCRSYCIHEVQMCNATIALKIIMNVADLNNGNFMFNKDGTILANMFKLAFVKK